MKHQQLFLLFLLPFTFASASEFYLHESGRIVASYVSADGVAHVTTDPWDGSGEGTGEITESSERREPAHPVYRVFLGRPGRHEMRFQPGGPDSSIDLTTFTAIKFWAYVSAPTESTLMVLLGGPRVDSPEQGGHLSVSVPLDFTGWQEFTFPLKEFTAPWTGPADLTQIRVIDFTVRNPKDSPESKEYLKISEMRLVSE